MSTEQVVSKGQEFLEKHGYSKTMSRLMNKHGVGLEDYRRIRKARKKKQAAEGRAKADAAKAGRKTKTVPGKK